MDINAEHLIKLCQLLMESIQKSGLEQVPLDSDYYWAVSDDDIENLDKEVPELVVGSLYDDWTSLQKVMEGASPLTSIDIERVAAVLNYLARYIQKSDNEVLF
ncbi:hypothetical protein [Bacillus badius]|uniref:Uncharacterized protein n=1 Tax=Bacillus badius TaxID=1455 RepID=A0ABR5AZH3_BACBA|nr:hypothetical protein [Bacillus badius]KIL74887.1 hypothetical protein SD78_1956 [Bacillus badius]KIL80135.1 hypothetical protein SD77_2589 [Bacillus badius]KZN99171.1 hypothetical protein A4244_08780 [Bacillus badius]KZR60051.1 hypothetical protein A3781_07560 [Bacillus badius]MED0667571.1 hypothetical protein [Bacillus badius]